MLLSLLDECAQAAEGAIPLLGDEVEVAARVSEALLPQLPDALATAPTAMHETSGFHHVKMFDGLTADAEAGGEPRDGHRSVITEAGHLE
jgi:hypothetical protein